MGIKIDNPIKGILFLLAATVFWAAALLTPDSASGTAPPSGLNSPGTVVKESVSPLTPESGRNRQPAVVATGPEEVWAAWITFSEGKGGKVVLRKCENNTVSSPIEVTPHYGDYLEPAIASDNRNRVWVFWSALTAGKAGIFGRSFSDGKWSPPLLLTGSASSDHSPAVCPGQDGRIWMAWQSALADHDTIKLASFDSRGSGTPVLDISGEGNNRDPEIAVDSRGKIWIAWCSAANNTYKIKLRSYHNGRLSPEITVSRDRSMYNMHPSLAVDPDDNLWIAWDSTYLRYHGHSGGSKSRYFFQERDHPPVSQKINLVKYDGKTFSRTELENPENGISPPGYELPKHGAFPQIIVDPGRRLWVFYRSWKHSFPENYYYSVVGQIYSSQGWLKPINVPASEGPLEKATAAAAGGEGVFLAYSADQREEFFGWQVLKTKEQAEEAPAGDYTSARINESKIYLRKLGLENEKRGGGSLITYALPPEKDTPPPPILKVNNPFISGQKHYRIRIDGTDHQLYWGNLHSHSNISRCSVGGEPTLKEYYNYMIDIGLYDFCALTDHVEHISLYDWWMTSQIADLYNIPGRFVTLFGYEWTGRAGHKNVIYPDRQETIFSSIFAEAGTPDKLWEILGNRKAITIPHHPAAANLPTDWSYHNGEFERLVEIFQSCRGSYEYAGCPRQPSNLSPEATKKGAFVQDALGKGYRMGFIGASDHGYGVAYSAVYAPELTREAVFDALYRRRCFAATEKGIFLDFRADGHIMGEEYTTENPPEITGEVIGTEELSNIDIFKNGEVIYSHPAPESENNLTCIHLEWAEIPESWKGTLRLSRGRFLPPPQSRGQEMVKNNEYQWFSGTPGEWSFRRDLIAECPPEAFLTLELPGLRKKFPLRKIVEEEIIIDLDPGKILLAKGDVPTRSLGTTRAQFEFTDKDFKPGTSWYYLRAIQMNGEMAWSSPIWVSKKDTGSREKIKSLGYTL